MYIIVAVHKTLQFHRVWHFNTPEEVWEHWCNRFSDMDYIGVYKEVNIRDIEAILAQA